MNRIHLVAGALLAGLVVALGAFGAHGLQNITSDEKILHGFQTAVQYQIYHALALLATGIIYNSFPTKGVKAAGTCFIIGIILFSGSLYLLTALKIQDNTSLLKIAGPITPIGGLFFIIGWLLLVIAFIRK